MSPSIVDMLNIPRELTLEFLVTFARFEYALKRAGYTNGSESGVLASVQLALARQDEQEQYLFLGSRLLERFPRARRSVFAPGRGQGDQGPVELHCE
jgi:hypothetical protein